ncbi:hypothetical protein TEQG_08735 [Trichophyton equinum CBS 127.97]|uniref:Uncharacterized protein n=1 Tax=Trichophyton equinum (strain ATCC MYA-4606 / CBS 127.97) TaxID=559882 RepID=F2PXQ5_TRIEC|nr:hypothetical protein TEQG_08735 [Trichophyton equinum CBS 127.97]
MFIPRYVYRYLHHVIFMGGYLGVKKTIEAIKNILTKFALYIPYTKDIKVEGLGYLIFKNVISLFDRALEPNYRALPKSQYLSTSEALVVALIGYKPELQIDMNSKPPRLLLVIKVVEYISALNKIYKTLLSKLQKARDD